MSYLALKMGKKPEKYHYPDQQQQQNDKFEMIKN